MSHASLFREATLSEALKSEATQAASLSPATPECRS
jgi:hypothetical protein